MIPALIAPAFVIPTHRPDTRAQWAAYTGALNGAWIDVTTYGGPAGGFGSLTDGNFDAALNRGYVQNASQIQLFRMDATLVPARLGDRLAHSHVHRGEFTADSQRIWLPTSGGEIRFEFAEYDASGLTQLGGAESDQLGQYGAVAPEVLVSDLDSTRAIASAALRPPGTSDPEEMRVGILQRSGGTILATLNSVPFGVSGSVAIIAHGARPLRADRSIVVFQTAASSPFALDVQGVAHAGTTPAADGSAVTLTSNVEGLSLNKTRVSRCLDGFGVAVGRFIVGWVDDTSENIHLRMVKYDGTTLTLGTELDTGLDAAVSGRTFQIENLGDGAAVLLLQTDPTVSGEGFAIVEYHPSDANELDLAMSSLGLQNLAKDGLIADETLQDTARVLPISRNRFAVAVAAEDFESVFLKVVHNGSDAIT